MKIKLKLNHNQARPNARRKLKGRVKSTRPRRPLSSSASSSSSGSRSSSSPSGSGGSSSSYSISASSGSGYASGSGGGYGGGKVGHGRAVRRRRRPGAGSDSGSTYDTGSSDSSSSTSVSNGSRGWSTSSSSSSGPRKIYAKAPKRGAKKKRGRNYSSSSSSSSSSDSYKAKERSTAKKQAANNKKMTAKQKAALKKKQAANKKQKNNKKGKKQKNNKKGKYRSSSSSSSSSPSSSPSSSYSSSGNRGKGRNNKQKNKGKNKGKNKQKNKQKNKGKKDNGKYGSGKHVTSRTTSQSTDYTSGTSGTSAVTTINSDSDTALTDTWKARYPGFVYVQQTVTDTQSITPVTVTNPVIDHVDESNVSVVRAQEISSPFSQSTGLGPFQVPQHIGGSAVNGEDQVQEFWKLKLATQSEMENLGMPHSSTTDANRITKVAKHSVYRHKLKRKKFTVTMHKNGTRRITHIVRNIDIVARTGYSPWNHVKTLVAGTTQDFATSHVITKNNDNTFTVTTEYWNFDPATVGGGAATTGWTGTRRKDTWTVPANEGDCLKSSLPKTTATIVDSSYPVARSGYASVPLILDATKTPMTSSIVRQTMEDILYFLFSVHYRFTPHQTREIRIEGVAGNPFGFSVTVVMDVQGNDPAKGVFVMVPIAYAGQNGQPPGMTSWDTVSTVRMTCAAQHIIESFDVPDGWVQL